MPQSLVLKAIGGKEKWKFPTQWGVTYHESKEQWYIKDENNQYIDNRWPQCRLVNPRKYYLTVLTDADAFTKWDPLNNIRSAPYPNRKNGATRLASHCTRTTRK